MDARMEKREVLAVMCGSQGNKEFSVWSEEADKMCVDVYVGER